MFLVALLLVSLASAQPLPSGQSGFCSATPAAALAANLIPTPFLTAAINNPANPPGNDFDGAWFGNGNSGQNGNWGVATETTEQVQLGLRLGSRYNTPVPIAADSNGFVILPAGETLKMDWSFRVYGAPPAQGDGTVLANGAGNPNYNSLQDVIDGGGLFEFGIDVDPTDDVNFFVYDPISFIARGGDGFMQYDSYFLDAAGENTESRGPTPPYTPPFATEGAAFSALLLNSVGIQNSLIPNFLPGISGLTGTDSQNGNPTLPNNGRFEVYFAYSKNGVELARVAFSVLKGDSTSGGFNPSVTPANLATGFCSPIQPSE